MEQQLKTLQDERTILDARLARAARELASAQGEAARARDEVTECEKLILELDQRLAASMKGAHPEIADLLEQLQVSTEHVDNFQYLRPVLQVIKAQKLALQEEVTSLRTLLQESQNPSAPPDPWALEEDDTALRNGSSRMPSAGKKTSEVEVDVWDQISDQTHMGSNVEVLQLDADTGEASFTRNGTKSISFVKLCS